MSVTDSMADGAAEVSEERSEAAPRRPVSPLVAAILTGLLALAVGFAAGVLVAKPWHPGSDSPEAGFARDMSIHHSQAVQMGMIAYQRASLHEVRTLGYDIALTQQAQIGIMRGWLTDWDVPLTSDQPPMAWMEHGEHMLEPNGRMTGMASPEQLEQLRNARGKQVDILFCRLMIVHHIAGVHMAEDVVERTDDEDVRSLAQGMVNAQQGEIEVMRDLLTKLGV